MSLPSTNQSITDNQVYPDSVELYAQYSPLSRYRFSDLQRSLRQLSGATASSGVTRFYLSDNVDLSYGRAEIRKAQSSNVMVVKIILDPLSYIRSRAFAQEDTEAPRNPRSTNYLPQSLVDLDQRDVWRTTNELVQSAEARVFNLLNDAGSASQVGVAFQIETLTAHKLELCCDYVTPSPDSLVDALVPVFRRHYNNQKEHVYRGSVQTRGVDGDSSMVSGFLRADERIKAYVKTGRRLRLECQLRKRALEHHIYSSGLTIERPNEQSRSHTRSRNLVHFDNDIANLINLLAPHVAAQFNMVLGHVEPDHLERPTAMELIVSVLSRTRSASTGIEVLRSLARNRSIETSRYRRLVRNLERDGVLETSVWGRRQLTARYSDAANFLACLCGWSRPFRMGVLI